MDTIPRQESAHIAILMGTYQGETYLAEQLDSIEQQCHTNWALHVSDDSPTPETQQLLMDYQQRWGKDKLTIYQGNQQGFAANFMSLVRNMAIQADHYAFADQDDRWHPDKLARALVMLRHEDNQLPLLYTARTRLVDARGRLIGYSPRHKHPPSFQNALVQNIASGNTMLFNHAARGVLLRSPHGEDTGLHDWWCYLLISGCGGRVIYDNTPTLDYRQHDRNIIGMQRGLKSLMARFSHLWKGSHRLQVDRNIRALEEHQAWLTPSNQASYQHYYNARIGNPWQRLRGLYQARVYRQTLKGNLAMVAAALLNKG